MKHNVESPLYPFYKLGEFLNCKDYTFLQNIAKIQQANLISLSLLNIFYSTSFSHANYRPEVNDF